MPEIRLCSSREVVAALKRAGFEKHSSSGGSHQSYVKNVGGRNYTPIVPLAKKQIPRGVMRSILKQAGLTQEEFEGFLR